MCPQCGSRGRRERDREKKKQFASAQLQLIFHMPSLFEITEINVRVSSPSVRLGLSRLFTQQAKHLLEIVCPVREAAEGARQCTPLLLLFASVRRTRRTARKERSRESVKKSKTTSRSKTKEQKPDRQTDSQPDVSEELEEKILAESAFLGRGPGIQQDKERKSDEETV